MLRAVRLVNSGGWYVYDTRLGLNVLYREAVVDFPEFPVLVQVQVTLRCTRCCPWCYVDKRPVDFDLEKLIRAIQRLARRGLMKVALTGGEPLVYPHLDRVVRAVKSLDLSLTLSTNGDLVERWIGVLKEVDEVRVSVYEFDRAAGVAELLRNEGARFTFNFLLREVNVDIVKKVIELVERFNVVRPFVTVVAGRNYSREELLLVGKLLVELIKRCRMPMTGCHTLRKLAEVGLRVYTVPSDVWADCGAGTWMICLTPFLTVKACSFCRTAIPLEEFLSGGRPPRDCT